MLLDPFPLLRPFSSILRVGLFTKADDIRSDADAAKALGADASAGTWQVHGDRVIVVRGPSARTEKADGMLTDARGLALCTRWADCQNFVILAPERRVAGVLHAGWKGVIGGAVPSFFRTLRDEWGIGGEDVWVVAGPSLCKASADFTDPKTELTNFPADLINGRCADLQEAATRHFLEEGVRPDRIERHADCTRCHPEMYWTYRGGHREEVKAGHTNMLACVLL